MKTPFVVAERFVLVALAIVICAYSFAGSISHNIATSDKTADVYSGVLEALANKDREASSAPALTVSPLLQRAAQAKANDMAARGYFSHYGPDGTTPWQWIASTGYQFTYAGENLAINFSDSVDVNNAWLASPLHRQNILNPHFTEIGVALARGMYNGRMTTFVVQMFGRPANIGIGDRVVRQPASVADALATNPRHVLLFVYACLCVLVLLSLGNAVLKDVHAHHTHHIYYAMGLIAAMALCTIILSLVFPTSIF